MPSQACDEVADRSTVQAPIQAPDEVLRGNPHVVVGVDGSAGSSSALRWAMTYAAQVGGTVEAISTWQLPMGAGYTYAWVPSGLDGDSYDTLAEKVLADTVAEVTQSLGSTLVVDRNVAQGQPADVLLQAARHAQMLVVGSRGHGTLAGFILGSTSQHCVQHAPCPVVVVPE
jgi:nucleotide-binding universal stress UspA family protein